MNTSVMFHSGHGIYVAWLFSDGQIPIPTAVPPERNSSDFGQ